MNSFVLDGLTGRKRRKVDPPRTERVAAPVPSKYRRIVAYFDEDDESSDDEPMDVESPPKIKVESPPTDVKSPKMKVESPPMNGAPVLDPDRFAFERSTGPSATNSIQPTMKNQSNDIDCVRTQGSQNYDFENICSNITNQSLINHLQQTDAKKRKEVLKNIFILCYQRSQGCLQKCKLMMEQLKINAYVKLDKTFPEIKEIRLTESKLSLCEDAVEKNELCDRNEILNKIIQDKYIELFGMEYYELDNEILEKTSIVPHAHPELNKNKKGEGLFHIIKVDSLNPSISSEIDDLAKSMADFAKKIQIRGEELELKKRIYKVISINDLTFSREIIDSLASYFSNEDFLLKCDELWKSSKSETIGNLIMKLVGFFNDSKNNMAYLSGCLVCVFRAIVNKSSIPKEKLQSKFSMFMNTIKKYVKQNDFQLWKVWFLPPMFFDWCLVLVNIFMADNKIANLKELQISNAKWYFRKIKSCQYILEIKTVKSIKSGIFEFSKSEDLLDIGLMDTNSEKTSVEEKEISVVQEIYVKKPRLEIDTKSTEELNKRGNVSGIISINTNSETKCKETKGIEGVKEPFVKNPGFKVDTKSAKNYEPMKKIELETSHDDINKLSATKTEKVLKSTCITKEINNIIDVGKKFIRVCSEFSEINSFGNSPTRLSNVLNNPISGPNQNIEIIKLLKNTFEKNTTQNNMIVAQPSPQATTVQNVSGAFFTIPNNPRKYHITNSVLQTNISIMQTHSSSTNDLATVSAQSNLFNVAQHPTNSYSSNRQEPNAYIMPNGPQVPYKNDISQNCYYNGCNTCSNGICQPELKNNTVRANNITENQFAPVPIAQIIHSNNSTMPYQVNPYNNTSHNYNQITSSANINKAQTTLLSNNLSNGAISSRAPFENSTSLNPSNSTNHQRSKSFIYTNPSLKNSSTASTYQPPEQIPQFSPDLPNAQSPNMPLQSNSNTRTLMHQKCTNANCYTYLTITDTFDQYSINCCENGHYCSVVCQNSDRYYHKNECYRFQKSNIN